MCSPALPQQIIGKMIKDALIPREFAYAVHHVANYFFFLLVASGQTNHKSRTAKLTVPLVLLYCFLSAWLCVNSTCWWTYGSGRVRLESGTTPQQSKVLPPLELSYFGFGLEGTIKIIYFQPPATFQKIRLFTALSSPVLNTFIDGASTGSLGSFPVSHHPHSRGFLPDISPKPTFSLKLLSLLLSLHCPCKKCLSIFLALAPVGTERPRTSPWILLSFRKTKLLTDLPTVRKHFISNYLPFFVCLFC